MQTTKDVYMSTTPAVKLHKCVPSQHEVYASWLHNEYIHGVHDFSCDDQHAVALLLDAAEMSLGWKLISTSMSGSVVVYTLSSHKGDAVRIRYFTAR
jgi:hypothetical protein